MSGFIRQLARITFLRLPVWAAAVAFLAVCAMWVRSHWRHDYFGWSRGAADSVMIGSSAGQITCDTSNWVWSRINGDRDIYRSAPTPSFWWGSHEYLGPGWSFYDSDFEFEIFRDPSLPWPHVRDFGVTFPHWAAAATLLPMWLVPTIVAVRRRFRWREGCCAKCGYDLRGTVGGACSECGAAKRI